MAKQLIYFDDKIKCPNIIRPNTVIVYGGDTPFLLNEITHLNIFTDIRVFKHNELTALNYISHIGALLSYNDDTELYTLWNGDDSEWDPHGSNNQTASYINNLHPSYGTLIAVCVGTGLWAAVNWSGLTNNYIWANNNTALYNDLITPLIHNINGDANTQYILNNYKNDISNTLWGVLNNYETFSGYRLYIPSKIELLTVQNNCCDNNHSGSGTSCTYTENIGRLLSLSTANYWSSSQYPFYYYYSYYVNFGNGNVYSINKTSQYRSVALLHFVAA